MIVILTTAEIAKAIRRSDGVPAHEGLWFLLAQSGLMTRPFTKEAWAALMAATHVKIDDILMLALAPVSHIDGVRGDIMSGGPPYHFKIEQDLSSAFLITDDEHALQVRQDKALYVRKLTDAKRKAKRV